MDQTSPNQQISQQIEQPQVPTNQEAPNTFTPKDKDNKKGLLFEIIFVVVFLVLLFGILNYFNILRLSEIFPQLGFLPRREVPAGTFQQSQQPSSVTLSPDEQAKQTLINFLPTVLTASFLPQSSSDITLTKDTDNKERVNASWGNKEGGTTWTIFSNPSNSQKIGSIDVFFEKIQTASPSVELAKSNISQVFSISPKGEWRCGKDSLNERKSYCENFWEEEEAKKGVGFLIINTSPSRGRLVFSFCEHSKDSNLYAWKSCRTEFAESGVR